MEEWFRRKVRCGVEGLMGTGKWVTKLFRGKVGEVRRSAGGLWRMMGIVGGSEGEGEGCGCGCGE